MLNGPELLQSFDERLAQAEREAAAAQVDANRLTAQVDAYRTAEAQALRELARLRLDVLGKEGGATLRKLDAASARARDLLDERARGAAGADADLAERRRTLQEATRARDAEAARLKEAQEATARAAAAARERLAADPEWVRLRDTAVEGSRIAQHAAQKADFALQDRETKGRPYLEDPLFSYLWNRGYGTGAYRAGMFTRLLDGFVARVARYDPARKAYALLTELPERLGGHATRMRQAAEAQAASLAAYEKRTVTDPGKNKLAEIRAALDRAEDILEAAHAALGEAERRRSELSDPTRTKQDAMAVLEAALSQESIRSLRDAAARTPTIQDDVVVARLAHAGAERAKLEPQIAQRRAEAQSAQAQVQQLLALRQEMRTRGYGRGQWNFGDGALLGMLVGQVLGGAISHGGFWSRMEQHRMPTGPWGDAGWGDASDGGGWGSSPWGGGVAGGFGEGGVFETGGGFGGGGGGFKTGGSF